MSRVFKWIHSQNKAYWKEAKENIVPTLIIAIIVAVVSDITGIEYMTVTVWFVLATCSLALLTVIYIYALTLYRYIIKKRNET